MWSLRKLIGYLQYLTICFSSLKNTKTLLNHTISTLLNLCFKNYKVHYTENILKNIYKYSIIGLNIFEYITKYKRKQRLNTQIAKLLICNLSFNGLKNNSCILLNFKHI